MPHGMDLSTLIFSLYQHIKVYSLFHSTLYFSHIHSETFSFTLIFSYRDFYINMVFFFFVFVFHYCIIHRNKNTTLLTMKE